MSYYQEEFKEYVYIIQKKTLRYLISQHYSANEVKLGALLSCCENSNSKIKNWILGIHRACKISKSDMSRNHYLSMFKLKLSQISDKLIDEIKCGAFNRVKLKKCAFVKKNSRVLPHDTQQLVSEIACFISETIDEDSINLISPILVNENNILKRKRFSRQLKESLIKYCKDFNNFTDSQDPACEVTNPAEEWSEIKTYFAKFDLLLPNLDNNKKLIDMECLLKDEIIFDGDSLKKSDSLIYGDIKVIADHKFDNDDLEFNEFDVVEEWNDEDCVEKIELAAENNFTDYLVKDFTDFINKTCDQILNDMGSHVPSDGKKALDIPCDFYQLVPENHSVSNLQQSYLSDIKDKLSLVIKTKASKKDSRPESDSEEILIRHKMLPVKPRPFIKILSLKKPNVYVDTTVVETAKEHFLESIPFPDCMMERKVEIVSVTKDFKADEIKVVTVSEECDSRVEESILESILDFSDVFTDDFECNEGKDKTPYIDDYTPVSSLLVDDKILEHNCHGVEPVLVERMDTLFECPEKKEDMVVIGSTKDSSPCRDVQLIHSNFSDDIVFNSNPASNITRSRTNYSVYSPEKRVCDAPNDFYRFEQSDYRYTLDTDSREEEDIEMYDYQPGTNYYGSQNQVRFYNHNNDSGVVGGNSSRYAERSSQRLFHNFLRYTTQSNEVRPFFNPMYRYRNDGPYRPNY